MIILLTALFVAGGRYAMTHGRHPRPLNGTVASVYAAKGRDGKTHYFLNVTADNDPLYTEPVEVDLDTLHKAETGQPWVVK
jgi:hypothetical protein